MPFDRADAVRRWLARTDRWEAEFAAMVERHLDRQHKVVLQRLKGPKGRRGTRHWQPVGIKALDDETVVQPKRWRSEIVDSASGLYMRMYTETAKDAAESFGSSVLDRRDEAVARVMKDRQVAIGEYSDRQTERIREIIRRLEAEGRSIAEIANALTDHYKRLSKSDATKVARTEVTGAVNGGLWLAAVEADNVTHKRWLATDDARVRPSHHHADGQVRKLGARFRVGKSWLRFPGDPLAPPSETVNCFPGDVLVTAVGVEGGYRRWYEGPLVTARTRSGRVLPGTPNHPVLTTAGWCALGDLEPGDHLVCGPLREEMGLGHPHVDGPPAPIAEVTDALGVARHRVAGRHVDFHGDGSDGEVEVVRADGELRHRLEAACPEPSGEHLLTATDLAERVLVAERLGGEFVRAGGRATSGLVGSDGQAGPLRGRCDAHALVHGGGAVPRPYPGLEQSGSDGATTDAEPPGYLLLGDALLVETDEVVDVQVKPFAGHVFNLTTTGGWYEANGIVVHNCRCALVFSVGKPEKADEPDEEKHLPDQHDQRTHGRGGVAGFLERLGRQEGGFTYEVGGNVRVTGKALSPYKDRERSFSVEPGTEAGAIKVRAELDAYRKANRSLLGQPDHYLGGWYHTEGGRYYLDVAIVVETREEAERLAREHDQIAYFDLDLGEEVQLDRADEGSKADPPTGEGAGDPRAARDGRGDRRLRGGELRGEATPEEADADNLYHLGHSHHTTGGRWFPLPGDRTPDTGQKYNVWHDRRGRFARRAGAAFSVFPNTRVDPVQVLGNGADRWEQEHETASGPAPDFGSIRVDPERLSAIAKAYDALPVDDPEAHAAYRQLAREVDMQYDYLTGELGIDVVVQNTDPYPDIDAMVRDVRTNRRIKVLSTKATGPHAFFTDEQNDRFRAVHDAFGHAATGRAFDRNGEEAAYRSHARMFSASARAALATETRGQNSWLITNGSFPVQKIALLPEQYSGVKHYPGLHDQDSHGRRGLGDLPEVGGSGKAPTVPVLPAWKPGQPYTTPKPEWVIDAPYEENSAVSHQWNREVRLALAHGDLDPATARDTIKYFFSGHDHPESFRGAGWRPLPPDLYHVTTAAKAVRRDGRLKTRVELSQGSGHGLGGGEDDTISFTDNLEIAEDIQRSMLEARRVARGETTASDLWEQATSGEGADRPYADDVARQWMNTWKRDESLPIGLRGVLEGVKYERARITDMSPPDGEGWEPVPELGMHQGRDQEFPLYYRRTLSEDELREDTFDFYKTWAAFRANAGGPMDPLFFSSDWRALAETDDDDIAIVHARPKTPKASGYRVSSLGEWRTTTGEVVEILEAKHLQGLHDQRSHGRRGGLPGLPSLGVAGPWDEGDGAVRFDEGLTDGLPSEGLEASSGVLVTDALNDGTNRAFAKNEIAQRLAGQLTDTEGQSLIRAMRPQMQRDLKPPHRLAVFQGALFLNWSDASTPERALAEDPYYDSRPGGTTAVWSDTEDFDRLATMEAVGLFVHRWAGTSNDSDVVSLAVQDAAVEEFGLKGTAGWELPERLQESEEWRRRVEWQEEFKPVYRRMLRAMYDDTQAWFRERGVTDMIAMRGWQWGEEGSRPPAWVDEAVTKMTARPRSQNRWPVTVATRPMSSWTTDVDTAVDFSGGAEHPSTAVLTSARIPVSRIIGTPRTGFGALPEYEVVVLGGTDEVMTEIRGVLVDR